VPGEQRHRIAELEAENADQRQEIEGQRNKIDELVGEVDRLRGQVAELQAKLNTSSQNSSAPPSSDSPGKKAEARKSRSERRREERAKLKAEARRRGKQPGAVGKNLPMQDDPDNIVPHEPPCCSNCGKDLSGAEQAGDPERRQVLDIADPRLICTEHQGIRRRCSCGTVTTGDFPPEAKAPVSYGPNVRANTLYLLHGQHLSMERTAEAMSAMLGVPVSTGFVASLVKEAAGGLEGFMEELRRLLRGTEVIHVDETPDQVRTDTWYFHVVASELYTYLFASSTRAKTAPDAAGVLLDFRGTMVHDRLRMYWNYDKATHAICNAHILRDLDGIAAVASQEPWAKGMKALLLEMNDAAHDARAAGRSRLGRRKLEGFLERYDSFVDAGLAANPEPPAGLKRDYLARKSYNLVCALRDLKTEATRFAKDLRVPFTNNDAERPLRMAKLHKKVSGCFQADDHARHFAAIRSYLGTARKHGVGALEVLGLLFRGDAWMPPART